MTFSLAIWVAVALFAISEIALGIFKRARLQTADLQDRGSMRALWVVITFCVSLAVTARFLPVGRLKLSGFLVNSSALGLLLLGLVIRWAAIITLGRFFTVDVAIHHDHRIIEAGLYRYVRHPSYSGLLLAFLGLGVALGSWLSLLILLIPISVALAVRIATEERALHGAFGPEYEAYCSRTHRLIPGLF